MAEFWESDPVVEDEAAPVDQADEWWKNDPVVEGEPAAIDYAPAVPTAEEEASGLPVPAVTTPSNTSPIGQIAENAVTAVADTVSGFVPKTGGQLMSLLTPLWHVPDELKRGFDTGKALVEGESAESIAKRLYPESQLFVEAEKTPPGSKERFAAGAQTTANILMGYAGAKGIASVARAKSAVKEPVSPIETIAPEKTAGAAPETVGTRTGETLSSANGPPPSDAIPSTIKEPLRPAPNEPTPEPPVLKINEQIAPEEVPSAPPEIKAAGEKATPSPAGEVAAVLPEDVPVSTPETAPKVTAIKNEQVDLERAQRGLPSVVEPARKGFGEVWDEAAAKIDSDPTFQDRLVSELTTNPRALTDLEDAALLHRQVDLQNQFERASNEVVKASEGGDAAIVADGQARLSRLSDDLLNLYNVTKAVGTETGRGLAARRMLAAEDFSLAQMLVKARVAKGGGALTPEESVRVTQQSKRIAETQRKIDEKREKLQRTPEQLLETRKKNIATRTKGLEEKVAAGDFTRPQKRPQLMDKELETLLFENTKAKREFYNGLFETQLAQRSTVRKILSGGREVLNTARAILTSLDLSAVLRQGGFITLGHPVRALKSFPAMFKALASEKGQFVVNEQIRNRPNAPLYNQSKLYLSDEGNPSLSKMEEVYMSRWAGKIPGVAASARAYTTFLNKLRADSFDAMAASLSRDGKVTLEESKAISNYVNVVTGRGNLEAAGQAAVGLNTVFFAPRYVVSRFQTLLGQPFYRGTARTRKLIAQEYGRALTGLGIVYGLAQQNGAEIETDPRSSDFGKLKFGDTRVDPMMGLSQTTTLLSRLFLGKTKTTKGEIIPTRGENIPFGGSNSADVIARFLRTKLAPVPGAAVDIVTGENVVGETVNPQSVAQRAVTPLALSDIYDTMQEQGVDKGTALGLLSIFGMGLQTHEEREPKPKKRYQ